MSELQQAFDVGLKEIQDALGDRWASLTPKQIQTTERVLERYLKLQAKKLAGEDVTSDLEFVEVSVLMLKQAGQNVLCDAIEKGVTKALEVLGTFLGAAARGFFSGL